MMSPCGGFKLEIEAFWRCGYILRRFSVADKYITRFSYRMFIEEVPRLVGGLADIKIPAQASGVVEEYDAL